MTVDERTKGGFSRLHFNANKFYGNVYGGGTTAGDGVFVYPESYGPLTGTRAETWRDGSEDYDSTSSSHGYHHPSETSWCDVLWQGRQIGGMIQR